MICKKQLVSLLALWVACACASPGEGLPDDIAPDQESGANPAPGPRADESTDGSIVLNRVRYVVGDAAITEADLADARDLVRRSGRLGGRNLEEAAAEFMIDRAIVNMEARRESIIVSDERLQNEVQRRMQFAGIIDEKEFRDRVERESNLTYEQWLENMRYELVKRQLIQIRITAPQPDDEEIERFYRRNRDRVGLEVRYREMVFAPRSAGIDEESRVSARANEAFNAASRNPAAFGDVARTFEGNVSPYRPTGGLVDFSNIQEIAERDQRLAMTLYSAPAGIVNRPFRDSRGRYVVTLVEAKRPIPLEKIRDVIRERLYFEKEGEAFEEWIKRRRREIAIIKPGG